jgi:hypothetical protein
METDKKEKKSFEAIKNVISVIFFMLFDFGKGSFQTAGE